MKNWINFEDKIGTACRKYGVCAANIRRLTSYKDIAHSTAQKIADSHQLEVKEMFTEDHSGRCVLIRK